MYIATRIVRPAGIDFGGGTLYLVYERRGIYEGQIVGLVNVIGDGYCIALRTSDKVISPKFNDIVEVVSWI